MKILMWAILNFHAGRRIPTPLRDKGNKLTYTRVMQENHAEMEIWAMTLGST